MRKPQQLVKVGRTYLRPKQAEKGSAFRPTIGIVISPEYGLLETLTVFIHRRKGELDYGMSEGLPGNCLFSANEAGYMNEVIYFDWAAAIVHHFREVLKSDEIIWKIGDGHFTHEHPLTNTYLRKNGIIRPRSSRARRST